MAKVYIAGKIKGLPKIETEKKFHNASFEIFTDGHSAVDPFHFIKQYNHDIKLSGGIPLSDEDPQQRREIMKICTDLLMGCDYIYLCHDWQDSEGATFEKQVADFFNIPIYNA